MLFRQIYLDVFFGGGGMEVMMFNFDEWTQSYKNKKNLKIQRWNVWRWGRLPNLKLVWTRTKFFFFAY